MFQERTDRAKEEKEKKKEEETKIPQVVGSIIFTHVYAVENALV